MKRKEIGNNDADVLADQIFCNSAEEFLEFVFRRVGM